MITLVIGDIHGCYNELQALLDKAGLANGDKIVAVGDIVDRGPETPQVLGFFQNTPRAYTLMGNHERKHVRASHGEIQLSVSQRISQFQLAEAYPEAVSWMGTLPLFLDLPEAIIVHGYLEPGISLSEQNPSIVCGTMGGERILREHYDRPWYELYDGERPVIMGHLNYTNSDQPFIYKDKVFGLETSCVMGKALTGLLLPFFRIISVPSRGNLWERVRREYRTAKRPGVNQAIESWSEQEAVLAKLRFTPGFSQLKPRQQAKMYADMVGNGPSAVLMQMARLGKLDLESARKEIRDAAQIGDIVLQIEGFRTG